MNGPQILECTSNSAYTDIGIKGNKQQHPSPSGTVTVQEYVHVWPLLLAYSKQNSPSYMALLVSLSFLLVTCTVRFSPEPVLACCIETFLHGAHVLQTCSAVECSSDHFKSGLTNAIVPEATQATQATQHSGAHGDADLVPIPELNEHVI